MNIDAQRVPYLWVHVVNGHWNVYEETWERYMASQKPMPDFPELSNVARMAQDDLLLAVQR